MKTVMSSDGQKRVQIKNGVNRRQWRLQEERTEFYPPEATGRWEVRENYCMKRKSKGVFEDKASAEAALIEANGEQLPNVGNHTLLRSEADFIDFHATENGYLPWLPKSYPVFAMPILNNDEEMVYAYTYPEELAAMVVLLEDRKETPTDEPSN